MSRATTNFVKASFIYFALGITLGAIFAIFPVLGARLRVVHAHITLLGWVSMLMYGVAYHILPRFRGVPLPRPRLADLQFILANVGLIGLVVFWTASVYSPHIILRALTGVFGIIEAVSGYLFVYNLWGVMTGEPMVMMPPGRPPRRPPGTPR